MPAVDAVHSQMLIGGVWVDSIEGRHYETVNPATEERLGSAPQADRADMRRVFMPYVGGLDRYRQKYDEVATAGYKGFQLA